MTIPVVLGDGISRCSGFEAGEAQRAFRATLLSGLNRASPGKTAALNAQTDTKRSAVDIITTSKGELRTHNNNPSEKLHMPRDLWKMDERQLIELRNVNVSVVLGRFGLSYFLS